MASPCCCQLKARVPGQLRWRLSSVNFHWNCPGLQLVAPAPKSSPFPALFYDFPWALFGRMFGRMFGRSRSGDFHSVSESPAFLGSEIRFPLMFGVAWGYFMLVCRGLAQGTVTGAHLHQLRPGHPRQSQIPEHARASSDACFGICEIIKILSECSGLRVIQFHCPLWCAQWHSRRVCWRNPLDDPLKSSRELLHPKASAWI